MVHGCKRLQVAKNKSKGRSNVISNKMAESAAAASAAAQSQDVHQGGANLSQHTPSLVSSCDVSSHNMRLVTYCGGFVPFAFEHHPRSRLVQ